MNNGLTLLYVEDNEIVQENFILIFQKYFSTVIATDNGSDALLLYKNNEIDVLILDISVPGIDGLSLAKQIREENTTVEIIMLTGHSEKEKLLDAMPLKLFSYLVKPVKGEELLSFLSVNASSHYTTCEIANIIFNEKSIAEAVCNNAIQLISRFKKKMLGTYNQESFFIDNIYGLGYKLLT